MLQTLRLNVTELETVLHFRPGLMTMPEHVWMMTYAEAL
jgi:hypothetical protein